MLFIKSPVLGIDGVGWGGGGGGEQRRGDGERGARHRVVMSPGRGINRQMRRRKGGHGSFGQVRS